MARPRIQIGEEVREMTDAEFAEHQAYIEEQRIALEASQNAKLSGRAKLAALGLTEAEIAALLGALT